MLAAIQLVAGFLLLWKGGDLLVLGADRFARARGMPASLAGVLILGFGTSAPELATSVIAALQGHPGIACGNVVGSNIANVALILGLAALLRPIAVDRFLWLAEVPIAIGASALAWALFADGTFARTDGLLFVLLFAVYLVFAARTAGRRPAPPPLEAAPHPGRDLLLALVGLACVVGGAHVFLQGSILAARALGVEEVVIGVTLVAVGTSLPELATTVAAARAGQMDLAVGNIVGSNIFNLLLVLGLAAAANPQPAAPRLLALDIPLMTALAVALAVLPLGRGSLRRWQGALLLLVYAAYLSWTAVHP